MTSASSYALAPSPDQAARLPMGDTTQASSPTPKTPLSNASPVAACGSQDPAQNTATTTDDARALIPESYLVSSTPPPAREVWLPAQMTPNTIQRLRAQTPAGLRSRLYASLSDYRVISAYEAAAAAAAGTWKRRVVSRDHGEQPEGMPTSPEGSYSAPEFLQRGSPPSPTSSGAGSRSGSPLRSMLLMCEAGHAFVVQHDHAMSFVAPPASSQQFPMHGAQEHSQELSGDDAEVDAADEEDEVDRTTDSDDEMDDDVRHIFVRGPLRRYLGHPRSY
ncbi:hypothetical protein AURDEDRAFT_169528 [Auricularia subglabra TFB-10046 SS5]|uniref:Uncharacterized protein n=1 Tax=Auricularia subglabra (strain TFB-10046 / SS5) TaxID=717982 RepID=J0DDA5_AURST|nr:hypothetical protein AURDEDRAFT_169528 [Auricularia subglabra TFB-10046 SS5]